LSHAPYYGGSPGRLTGVLHLPGERDELHRDRLFLNHSAGSLLNDSHRLWRPLRPERYDKPSTDSKLFHERRRDLRGCRRNHDPVEWRVRGPSLVPIASTNVDVGEPELLEQRRGACRQFRDDLDGPYLTGKAAEHCRLVPRAGSDFEHLGGIAYIEQLGHVRHDVRLRYGLTKTYRKRHIVVGLWLGGNWDESLAWDRLHHVEHTPIDNAAMLDLPFEHIDTAVAEKVVRRSGLLQPTVGDDFDDRLAMEAAVLDENVPRVAPCNCTPGNEQVGHVAFERFGVEGG
jgi:hypothetical protein